MSLEIYEFANTSGQLCRRAGRLEPEGEQNQLGAPCLVSSDSS